MNLQNALRNSCALEGAVGAGGRRDCILNLAKCTVIHIVDRRRKVHVIESVVGICADLQREAFGFDDLLHDAKVGVFVMRAKEGVAAQRAKGSL